ncbi:hypothetical protein [Bosea sp. PAMC 26642]|uniref:hypothetical protein n=1 Tax=Bosea sp. (strain PAMC 26642) TaxID=1792307 RepID=UPI00076FEFCC|nr:hypothetical protein [Bosea sp. PAMC 26642]AMJ61980.1 hypothetical protein AXW83_18240 [Bosea sp. PAMC 26642]
MNRLSDRVAKLEQRRSIGRSHVLFGKSHDDVEIQRLAMIRAGQAGEHDHFIKFVTIYEERPQ